jgi:hypothetical protein
LNAVVPAFSKSIEPFRRAGTPIPEAKSGLFGRGLEGLGDGLLKIAGL